jgi:hypothetical protein
MAKRARGAVRPGQRRATARTPRRPTDPGARPTTPTVRPGGLTVDEEQRAAEIEARILAEERAAEDVRRRRTVRERDAVEFVGPRPRTAQAGGLAAQAAEEYGYVVRDVRRIATIAGGLLAVLFGLFVLIDVAHVLTI